MICIVSGGFDPLHSGHLQMLSDVAEIGPVCVLLNSDSWLIRKKGFVFMPWNERAKILRNLKHCVDHVLAVDDSDGSVVTGLDALSGHYRGEKLLFCNGGDRTKENTPEEEFCRENNIILMYNCGGGKTQSSSELVKNAMAQKLVLTR